MAAPDTGWFFASPHGAPQQFACVFRSHPTSKLFAKHRDALLIITLHQRSTESHYRPLSPRDILHRRVADTHEDDHDQTPITICFLCGQQLGCWMCEHTLCSHAWRCGDGSVDTLANCVAMLAV